MNLTLSADEKLVEKARSYAAAHGTSLNQMIRDYLERVVGEVTLDEAAQQFAAIAREHAGNSGGGRSVRREEIYAERMRILGGRHAVAEDPHNSDQPGDTRP